MTKCNSALVKDLKAEVKKFSNTLKEYDEALGAYFGARNARQFQEAIDIKSLKANDLGVILKELTNMVSTIQGVEDILKSNEFLTCKKETL